jgi:hypothetical protein
LERISWNISHIHKLCHPQVLTIIQLYCGGLPEYQVTNQIASVSN